MSNFDLILAGIAFVCMTIVLFYGEPILLYFNTGICSWGDTDWVIVWLVVFICIILLVLGAHLG